MALEILHSIDERAKHTALTDAVRVALVGSNPKLLYRVFPEWKPDDEPTDFTTPDVPVELVPESENEVAALEAALQQMMNGVVTAGDLDGGGEWI